MTEQEHRTAAPVPHGGPSTWRRLQYYLPYAWRFVVLRRPAPLIYGVALTDRCNLHCRGCAVANTGRPSLTWPRLTAALRDAYARGFRDVYFSGGEPTLWQDGDRTLADAVAEARRIGFFHVHVYTNGTRGLPSSADLVWVSVDGLPATYARRRGDHFARVEQAVREAASPATPRVAVIYVIDRTTQAAVEPFLRWVRDTAFPVVGVMFYFHTPYYGYDELFLDRDERAGVIDRLLACSRAGLPVMNSGAGLRALRSGDWPRRFPVSSVLDVDGESVCCRAGDDVCPDCGYAACTELTELQRLRPSAIRGMLRYW
jgi:MoaA/NifB/PqqE/SkfB family radical SAM enzyme